MAALNVRSVLVTGSNRGIGLELIRQLAGKSKSPEFIFATCRDPAGPQAQDLKNLAAKNQGIEIIPLDTCKPSSIKAAVAKVTEQLKGSGLNLLINNAGIVKPFTALESETPEGMLEVYKTNVVGTMMTNISEQDSKAALNMLTKCQSLGYAEDQILCVPLHPGWLQTEMGNSAMPAPMTVEEGVQKILDTLSQLSEKDSGTFVDLEGKVLPW